MRRLLTVALMALVAGTLGMTSGQDSNNAPQSSNALVARLSAISGTVSTQRGDTGEWDSGAINTPLVSGDKVAAGEASKAEVQLDYADLLRLASNTQANLTSLNKDQIQVQIAAGLADFVVLKRAQASSEIDTPNIAVRPRSDGVYRIEVDSDSQTVVIVRKGEADISTPQGSTLLRSGQQITVQGTGTPEYQIADAPARDDWDRWNQQRDDSVQSARSVQYTNPYYTGVQDLDGYGYWTSVPGYGQVWVPNEGSDWTPYSDGRWQWQPYWGWTWVDYSPWGWAPYHYGRWFVYGPRWVWWPGPVTPYYQPVWAPAYVSFFGWGGGFGVNVGFGWGSIGWLPIGPCDPFRPWWGGGFNRVNVTNITNITNINNFNTVNVRNGRIVPPLAAVGRGRVAYSNLASLNKNARVRAAVMRVPAQDFGRGVMSARQHVTPVELRSGKAFNGTLPVVPTRASLSSGRAVSARALPRNPATHFFGSRGTVAQPSFTQERGRIAGRLQTQNARPGAIETRTPPAHAVAGNTAASARTGSGLQRFGQAGVRGNTETRTAPAPRAMPREVAPQPARPANGMQRFGRGQASTPAPVRQASPAVRPADHGWQRFGSSAGANATSRGNLQAPASRPQSFERAPAAPLNRIQPQSQPQARPGWQHFDRNSGSAPSSGGFRPAENGASSRGFDRPSDNAPRSFERGPQPSRPALEVGHPIVEAPRPSYRSSSEPSYRSSPPPSYRSSPAPSYRSSPAPSYHPSAGGGGRMSIPHVSAPSTPHYSSGGGGGGGRVSHGGGGHPH
ncbi:MAG: DUF6600 domain-containing protein [Terriglobales bacterium]